MLSYLAAGVFLICCGITAGTIYLLSQLRAKFAFGYLSPLLFLLVFHSMFGFYSLWGQFIIGYLLQPFIQPDMLARIYDIAMLMGSPFLVFGWLMLLRFAWEYRNGKFSHWFTGLFLLIHVSVITLLAVFQQHDPHWGLQSLLKYYYIIAVMAMDLSAALKMMQAKSIRHALSRNRLIMPGALVIAALLQSLVLLVYHGNILLALLFIFLFFAGTGFLPIWLNYSGDMKKELPVGRGLPSLGEFFRKYEISPREKEIITEICNGLTNQQIADKLFISLQTVKDHTHRIYSKVDVGSRMQLMRMISDLNK